MANSKFEIHYDLTCRDDLVSCIADVAEAAYILADFDEPELFVQYSQVRCLLTAAGHVLAGSSLNNQLYNELLNFNIS